MPWVFYCLPNKPTKWRSSSHLSDKDTEVQSTEVTFLRPTDISGCPSTTQVNLCAAPIPAPIPPAPKPLTPALVLNLEVPAGWLALQE